MTKILLSQDKFERFLMKIIKICALKLFCTKYPPASLHIFEDWSNLAEKKKTMQMMSGMNKFISLEISKI